MIFILFNAILHFEPQDRARELWLLEQAAAHIKPNGLLCAFIHKSDDKESLVKQFVATSYPHWKVFVDRYIDYTYAEKAFRSTMQFTMYVVQRL